MAISMTGQLLRVGAIGKLVFIVQTGWIVHGSRGADRRQGD